MSISNVENHNIITVLKETTILEAAKLMRQFHVGQVIVVSEDKKKAIGIVTDRDIVVELVATGLDSNVITVGDIMVNNLEVVKDNFDFFDALNIMARKGIRSLPVISDKDELVGLITFDTLIMTLTEKIGFISRLLKTEQKNEMKKRR